MNEKLQYFINKSVFLKETDKSEGMQLQEISSMNNKGLTELFEKVIWLCFNSFSPADQTQCCANSVDPDVRAFSSESTRFAILVFEFWLTS